MLVLALLTLAAAFLLIGPDPARTYPGNQPWSDISILRDITRVLALGGTRHRHQGRGQGREYRSPEAAGAPAITGGYS